MPTDESTPEVTDPADLYSLPLDQFTAARDLLARWLRSQDRGDDAATVRKFRKPSVAAWALNRVSRTSPDLVGRLLESHRLLREAASLESMQSASEARRQAVTALIEAAVAELKDDGRSGSSQTRDRISATLLAVATDPEAEAQLEEGRLVRELEPSGSGWSDFALTPVPVDQDKAAAATAEQARARAERLEKELAGAERQLEIAEGRVKEARRRVKVARAQSEEASSEATRAEEATRKSASKN